jgi:hypothetical protein
MTRHFAISVWQRFIIVVVFIIVVATFAIAVAMTRTMVISNKNEMENKSEPFSANFQWLPKERNYLPRLYHQPPHHPPTRRHSAVLEFPVCKDIPKGRLGRRRFEF